MKSKEEFYRDFFTSKELMLRIPEDAAKFLVSEDEAKLFTFNQIHEVVVKFITEIAKNSYKQNIDIVFDHAESEIEKIFLNSLIAWTCYEKPFFLYFTKPLTSPIKHIEGIRKRYGLVLELIGLLKELRPGEDPLQQYMNFIDSVDDTEESKFEVINFFISYIVLNFYEKFHVSIQSTFQDIKVGGKSIRPDIFIWLPSVPDFKLIVECDGYKYHSDKYTFSNDKSRDRILQTNGFKVLRFSGHEIFGDPMGKSAELLEYLTEIRFGTHL